MKFLSGLEPLQIAAQADGAMPWATNLRPQGFVAAAAVQIYLRGRQPGFERRWREAAFLPIITPSVAQLKTELARQPAQTPAGPAA